MGSSHHHISTWEHREVGVNYGATDGQDAHYVMSVYGWMCASHATWGAEESPRARVHAVERHVEGLPEIGTGVDNLARLIERWWEEEASYTADCAAPDPSLCHNHVFEEAVRVDGEIVACTVHGGRLARSLAAFLVARQAELEQQIREQFRRDQAAFEDYFRRVSLGTWPANEHQPGCGAGKDAAKRCICAHQIAQREVDAASASPLYPLPPELRL